MISDMVGRQWVLVCNVFFKGIVGRIHKYVVCTISGICIVKETEIKCMSLNNMPLTRAL